MDNRFIALEKALDGFKANDMRMVLRIVKDWQTKLSTKAMRAFEIGDAVEFTTTKRHGGFARGRVVHGLITGFNRKSVAVRSDQGENWRVAPSFLRKDSGRKR